MPPFKQSSNNFGPSNGPRPETYGGQKPYGGYQDHAQRNPEFSQAQDLQKESARPVQQQIVASRNEPVAQTVSRPAA